VSGTVILIDIFATVLIIAGLTLTFRQGLVRRLLHSRELSSPDDEDKMTYILRIAGTMMMTFGASLAILFTSFAHLNP
jgi:ABC-type phosphate transport system permease subunit